MCLKGDIVEMLEKYMCNLLVTFLAVKNNAVKKKKNNAVNQRVSTLGSSKCIRRPHTSHG